MNNTELDKVLKRAQVPEASAEFLKELPGNVQRAINRGDLLNRAEKAVGAQTVVGLVLKRALPLALAAVCVMLGFIWGANSRKGDTLQRSELTEEIGRAHV